MADKGATIARGPAALGGAGSVQGDRLLLPHKESFIWAP